MSRQLTGWDELRHTLGVPDMDATHREFMLQLESLIAASNEDFPLLFQSLVNHMRLHFLAEGQLMRDTRYKGLPEHESEHHRVLGEMQQLNRSLRRGCLSLARAYVREGLTEWFATHLTMMDTALAMHLKKQA